MKIRTTVLLLASLQVNALSITPVHVGSISIDTSIYDLGYYGCSFVPGPGIEWQSNDKRLYGDILLQGFRKKNSNQIDIYSFNGKIGTTVLPMCNEKNTTDVIEEIVLSCTMLDDDIEWESLVTYRKQSVAGLFFKVFDHDGTEILADSGPAFYGFDGNNTYIVMLTGNIFRLNYDTWRFRTNISSESPKTLSKTKSIQSSPMQIYGLPGGDYRVTLSPSSGNQINFQMFDLLGRCVFDKQIENLNRSVSFTVPEGNVPNSPFIAKVNDGNNTVVKKQIPVK
jgi:hypothetical protein